MLPLGFKSRNSSTLYIHKRPVDYCRWQHIFGYRWQHIFGYRWQHLFGYRWQHLFGYWCAVFQWLIVLCTYLCCGCPVGSILVRWTCRQSLCDSLLDFEQVCHNHWPPSNSMLNNVITATLEGHLWQICSLLFYKQVLEHIVRIHL